MGVGGTTLNLSSSGSYGSETAWSDSGGGYGAASLAGLLGGEPAFQSSAKITDSGTMRGVPDVAFDADPNTGVYVYCSPYWYSVGGTSVGAPNWAAIAADNAAANSGFPLNLANLYGTVYGVTGAYSSYYASDMHDITSGNNGYYSASKGWDAVTGIGTPIVSGLLITKTQVAAPTVSGISPSSGPAGGGTVVTITGTNLSGATGVKFGTTAGTSLTVNSGTSIKITSPAGTGTVDVTVTTSGGTSATSTADKFTY